MDIIGRPRIEDDGTKENAGGQHRADFKADRRGHSAKGVQSWTFPRHASLKSASQTHARSIQAPPLCGALLLLTASTLWIDKPVTLLPGGARLATSPLPTGSPLPTNTIGMTDVARLAAIVGGVAPLNPSVNQLRGPEREARGRHPVCTDRGTMHKAHDPKESAIPHVTYRAIATPPVIRSTPPTRDRPVRQCLLPQYPFRCPSQFWRGARQQ